MDPQEDGQLRREFEDRTPLEEIFSKVGRTEVEIDRGDALVDADVKRIFIFRNTDGVFVVRILDLPPGLGLRGWF